VKKNLQNHFIFAILIYNVISQVKKKLFPTDFYICYFFQKRKNKTKNVKMHNMKYGEFEIMIIKLATFLLLAPAPRQK
jgi:hypothetical protein